MKFVLVINLTDDVAKNYDVFTVDYTLRGDNEKSYDWLDYAQDVEIKPLPQKMKHEDEIDYDYGYIDGRNELIDEITGEK